MRLLVCVVFAASACYAPTVQDNVPCSAEGACPGGQTCMAGTCRSMAIDAAPAGDDVLSLVDGSSLVDSAVNLDGAVTAIDAAPDSGGIASPFALTGQRWLLPCTGAHAGNLCPCATASQTVVLTGSAATTYSVKLRVRGIFEIAPYTGGTGGTDPLYTGGAVNDAFHNIYEITVSAPSQHYFVNSGTSGGVSAVDYSFTIPIAGNATVVFDASGQDSKQGINNDGTGTPITIPMVTTNPQPYDGQFGQIDVISAI